MNNIDRDEMRFHHLVTRKIGIRLDNTTFFYLNLTSTLPDSSHVKFYVCFPLQYVTSYILLMNWYIEKKLMYIVIVIYMLRVKYFCRRLYKHMFNDSKSFILLVITQ